MQRRSFQQSISRVVRFSRLLCEGGGAMAATVWPAVCLIRYALGQPPLPPDGLFIGGLVAFVGGALLRRDWSRTRFLIAYFIPLCFFAILGLIALSLFLKRDESDPILLVIALTSALGFFVVSRAGERSQSQSTQNSSHAA